MNPETNMSHTPIIRRESFHSKPSSQNDLDAEKTTTVQKLREGQVAPTRESATPITVPDNIQTISQVELEDKNEGVSELETEFNNLHKLMESKNSEIYTVLNNLSKTRSLIKILEEKGYDTQYQKLKEKEYLIQLSSLKTESNDIAKEFWLVVEEIRKIPGKENFFQ